MREIRKAFFDWLAGDHFWLIGWSVLGMTSSLGVFNPNIEFFQAMVITGIGGLLTMSAWVRARRHKEGNVMDTMVLLAPLGGALLLVGGMLGAIWGNQGTLTLRKGEASEVFFDKAGRTHPLNFSVRLKDFQIEYYPQGEDEPVEQPIQKLRSVLEIRESKQVQKESVVQVNQPVSYKGYTFYQMDYNPEDLTWSGLGVIKNPGVPVISVGLAVFSVGLLVTLLRYHWTFAKRWNTLQRGHKTPLEHGENFL